MGLYKQIDENGNVEIAEDEVVRDKKTILCYLKDEFPNYNVDTYPWEGTGTIYKIEKPGEETHYIAVAAITYLGFPHPIEKKRMQIKSWMKDFYESKPEGTYNIIGIYKYKENIVYCDFNTEDYMEKKAHNSSAHVCINDLFKCFEKKVHKKQDYFKNNITFYQKGYLKELFDYKEHDVDQIVRIAEKFNSQFKFDIELFADKCIEEMKNNSFKKYAETEWAGWYLEYLFDKFLKENHLDNIVVYQNNNDKKELDFDLFFVGVSNKFYGDLKSSDISKKNAPGNDEKNTMAALDECEKLWYLVYEHQTEKDKNHNNDMALKRMKIIGKYDEYEKTGKISYKSRMKYSVKYKQMHIFEVNKTNKDKVLKVFRQGHNSGASQKDRAVKFLLMKKNFDEYVIYSYEK